MPGDDGGPTMLMNVSNFVIQEQLCPARLGGLAPRFAGAAEMHPATAIPKQESRRSGKGVVLQRKCRPTTMIRCLLPPFRIQSLENNLMTSPGTPRDFSLPFAPKESSNLLLRTEHRSAMTALVPSTPQCMPISSSKLR